MHKIFERESSSQIRNGNRRYIKRGLSPQQTRSGSSNFNSNKQSFSKLASHVYHHPTPNARYSDKNNRFTYSKDQIKSKQESLINIELLGLSNSKNFIGDRRKKGKSSFYKRGPGINNLSEIYFDANPRKQTGSSNINKNSSQSESSVEHNENQVQQLHYKMVAFQQKCKKMVIN